jgi:rhodanese-related sulfurtransferase
MFTLFAALALGQTKDLTPEELGKLLEQKDKVFFLDVRSPAEIEKLGSVKGYVNIPLDQLEARLKEVPKEKLIVTL